MANLNSFFCLKNVHDINLCMYNSMTTLVEHSSAKPRECSFLPKKSFFFIGLVWIVHDTTKNRALC